MDLKEISAALMRGRVKIVEELTAKALDEGVTAKEILENALLAGMQEIGERFSQNKAFVPEVMIAAKAMNAGMAVLKPRLVGESVEKAGKVCIGTIKGDQHDIGKNLVKIMMEGAGLEVIDLGVNVPPKKFVDTAVSEGCDIISCSALLTTTMSNMSAIVTEAEAAGIRSRVRIMIGGAPVTQAFCDKIGADCYTSDAASAAREAVRLVKALRNN